MDKNWVVIFSTTSVYVVDSLMVLLKENNIDSIKVDHQSSAYPSLNALNNIDLMVHQDNVIKAKHILEKHNN